MKMKRIVILLLGMFCLNQTHAQVFRGQYISEWQWDMNKNTNLVNQLRLELSIPIGNGKDSFEAATLHVAAFGEKLKDYKFVCNAYEICKRRNRVQCI